MKLCELTDLCAQAECRRLLLIVNARRRQEAQWFGHDSVSLFEYDENSAFVCGMVSLFRYARGEAVPPVLVESFLDTFLNMMFCGLASGVLALPSFKKMEDRPWAMAWRLAEIRLALEGMRPVDTHQLAHLLGVTASELARDMVRYGDGGKGAVSSSYLHALFERLLRGEEVFVG